MCKLRLREDANNFFFVVEQRRGGGDKIPLTTKQKPETYETQEKLIITNCMLCSVLVNINQQKKVIEYFILKFKFYQQNFINFLSILTISKR